MIPLPLLDLVHRANTTSTDFITNISILRYTNITNVLGLDSNGTINGPNWGLAIFHTINVYPDYLGEIAYVIIFSIPFVMMWIAHADMTAPSIVGIFLGVYIFAFIGSQYQMAGILFIAISIAALVWSVWQKRG